MAKNKNLEDFHSELKALLKKYNVALDIKAEIVAADLSAITQQNATEAKESVGLVGN
jgi:hypothetical protein